MSLIRFLLLSSLMMISLLLPGQTTRYVSTAGNDVNAGTSWLTAYRSIQKAIQVAETGDQIWVARGSYYPDEGPGVVNNNRGAYFTISNGVHLFGGFAGTETNVAQRNISANPTIIDANIQQDIVKENNAYKLFEITYLDTGYVVDGFIFSNAYAVDNTGSGQGTGNIGFDASGSIVNCTFNNNATIEGGALHLDGSKFKISNCIFENNTASGRGGAVQTQFSQGENVFINCLFKGNKAGTTGGAVSSIVYADAFINCTFYNNRAGTAGGAIDRISSVDILVRNCIFAQSGAQPLTFYNGIPASRYKFSYSIIDFGLPEVAPEVYFNDPQFQDSTNGNFRLQACSPAINRGLDSLASEKDLDNKTRVVFERVDMGAYEFQGPVNPARLYVKANAAGANNGTSWANAFTKLKDAISATSCFAVSEIWVAEGTYYPDEGQGAINNDRNSAFAGIRSNVTLYGGFIGNETSLQQRNLKALFYSELSGEIQKDGIGSNNAYNVFTSTGLDSSFVLDGFVLRDGWAANPNVPDNTSTGAGMFLSGSSITIKNCQFRQNTANYAASVFTKNAHPTFINCWFSDNTTLVGSGILLNDNASPRMYHCTIADNHIQGPEKTILANSGTSSPVIANCIIWGSRPAISGGTPVASYSIIDADNIFPGTANIDLDPQLQNNGVGDFRLTACSPAINKGTIIPGINTDIWNDPRGIGGANDIGAHEFTGTPEPERIYVKANASGANDGSSWANAFTKLQQALFKASTCTRIVEIWVAGGTYYPDEGGSAINNDRNVSFVPRRGLSIYGGFAGIESLLSQRNLAAAPSILTGEIQQDNVQSNNSNNIVIIENISSTLLIDGFTIEKGFTSTVLPENKSRGAGILVLNSKGVVRNCYIRQNIATYGSAITTVSSTLLFVNCVISGNTTTSGNGHIWNDNSSPSFFHCTVANNPITGSEYIIVKNTGTSSPTITSCIIRGTIPSVSGGTPAISYSIIQHPSIWPGTGNSNADPLFVSEAGSNLQLSPCSPAINTGLLLFLVNIDILGNARPALGKADMGAYEFQPNATSSRIYVKANAAGANNGTSWINAYTKLNDAIARAKQCGSVTEIWVANGNYYPDEGAGIVNNDRNANFAGRNWLTIYGGFAGTETLLSERIFNWNNPSTLTGNLQQDATDGNNAYNVLLLNNLDSTFIIDGFTIRDGYAENNDGTFKSFGAGIAIQGGNPIIRNCFIVRNTATHGAAITTLFSAPKFINCVVTFNHTTLSGGIIYHVDGAPSYFHSSIATNIPGSDSSIIFNTPIAGPFMRNSIVKGSSSPITSGTPNVSYCMVQGNANFPGTGNVRFDPLFMDETNGDLRLRRCSPMINRGNQAFNVFPTDVTGQPRTLNGQTDMGAYEREQSANLYVDANAAPNGDGVSWATAFTTLQEALAELNSCNLLYNIYLATGTYITSASMPFLFNRQNAQIQGGYPTGGGTLNPNANPVIIKGNVQVLQSLRIDGVKVVKP